MGLCEANTTNGDAIEKVWPSTVTWRSLIHSKRDAWVFAGARLISSINTIFPKIGPQRNSNSLDLRSNIEEPVTSEGIKSGVNCIRLKSQSIAFAISLAVNVLVTPCNPSLSHCQPDN